MNKIKKYIAKAEANPKYASIVQFVKFGLVGVMNTVLSYVIYAVCIYFGLHYVAANIIAFVLSVLNSYFFNNRYVFKAEGGERTWWKTLLKTYMSYAFTGLLLTNVLSYLWIDKLGLSEYLAPVLNVFINTPINFVLNKLWAYRTKKNADDAENASDNI